MKAKQQSDQKENTSQIIQRKDKNSFVKSKADAGSFTPPTKGTQNKSLPSGLQSNMESSLGQDFSNVGIQTNSQKAVQMNARAYTQGEQVHFAPGEFNPNSTKGKNLIGHEFTHVAQQRAGVVKPTKILQKGVAINDNKSLEREADVYGKKAVKGESVSKYRGSKALSSSVSQTKKSENKMSLSDKLVNTFSPVQMQSTIVQFTLLSDLRTTFNGTSTPSPAGIITTIRAASVAERQAVLGDSGVMTLIRSNLVADDAARIMSELMVGSQEWENPRGSDFYKYFVVNKGTGELPTTDSMNCWESIMYAAYLAGQIDTNWIYDFYNRAGVVLGTPLTSPNPTPQVWAALGWTSALPTANSSGGSTGPSVGDLIFYTPSGASMPSHVAVYVGNGEVISLWNKPNGVDTVQRISITAIGGTIQYGPKPW